MDDVTFGIAMGSPFLIGTLALGFIALLSGKIQRKN